MHVATLKWREGECNAPFPIRFKGDFGGDQDIGPAAKEDVDEFSGCSRAPRGRILPLFRENFKIVSATSKPAAAAARGLGDGKVSVPFEPSSRNNVNV